MNNLLRSLFVTLILNSHVWAQISPLGEGSRSIVKSTNAEGEPVAIYDFKNSQNKSILRLTYIDDVLHSGSADGILYDFLTDGTDLLETAMKDGVGRCKLKFQIADSGATDPEIENIIIGAILYNQERVLWRGDFTKGYLYGEEDEIEPILYLLLRSPLDRGLKKLKVARSPEEIKKIQDNMIGSLKRDRLLNSINGEFNYFLEEALKKGECSFDSNGKELTTPASGTLPGTRTLKNRFQEINNFGFLCK